jgi:Zn finger protein HypA/HybF involved in hydrogenase expression
MPRYDCECIDCGRIWQPPHPDTIKDDVVDECPKCGSHDVRYVWGYPFSTHDLKLMEALA